MTSLTSPRTWRRASGSSRTAAPDTAADAVTTSTIGTRAATATTGVPADIDGGIAPDDDLRLAAGPSLDAGRSSTAPGATAAPPREAVIDLTDRVVGTTATATSLLVRPTIYLRLFKRPFDVAGAAVLLAVTSPVLACAAVATRVALGSPVWFLQERVGRDATDFRIRKIRTMKPPPPEVGRHHGAAVGAASVAVDPLRVKDPADPRHTRLGRVLRKWSIDEVPQLVNVLHGDMSLVGPRPELLAVVDALELRDHPRHLVRPGLTGPWQISPYRRHPLHLAMHLDVEYVQRVTLRGDLRILAATVGAVLAGSGR